MRSIFFLLFFVFTAITAALAQYNGSIRGTLMDTILKPVPDATVTVLDAKDSSLVSFSRSVKSGNFMIKGLDKGNYRLVITHIAYRSISRNFVITDPVKEIDLGIISLGNKSSMLNEVTVMQEQAPVTIKNDTVEFNAGSFKTKPNAVVEDLLKKLPGVQVDKNGKIKANGAEVKKVLVDGKEFFGNDPKIASKNLPADAVDKVQVFDKKSDQSQFTGFDDGNSEKTINLTIKQDKKNGMFGRATAGGGNNSRYEEKFNLNKFKGNQQLSVLGMANNTNKQGFSFQDVINFSGAMPGNGGRGEDIFNSGIAIQGLSNNNQAITTTWAGGLNFSDILNKKTDVNGSYFYNRADDRIDQKSSSQYLLPDSSFTQNQKSLINRQNENQRISLISDYKIDSFNSLKLSSSFIYQNSNTATANNYSSVLVSGGLLNDGFANSFSKATGDNWNNNALIRHRFAKKGRTISANLSLNLNNNSGNGNLYSINNFYQTNTKSDTLNQVNDQTNNAYSYGAVISYTEPLSKKSLLEFNYNFNQIHSASDKKTFDADFSGKYTLPNAQLSNDFKNIYTNDRQTINFRNQQKNYNFSIGIALQEASLKNNFKYLSVDSLLHQSFLNFLPNANFEYKINKYKNLRGYYYTFTRQPSVTQLQPVPDNSDPLNIKLGNPDLQQEYYHSIRLNYLSFDPFRHTSVFAMLNYNGIHHKIVNDDILGSTGTRITKPVNLNGLFNVNGNLSWGFPVRKIKSNLNLNSNIAYNHNASLVNEVRNNSNSWTIEQGADLNFIYKELLDITAGVKVNYNDVRYSLLPTQNANYWMQNYTLDFNLYLPKGFSIASDVDYVRRTGLSNGYNNNPVTWNAGLAKQLFKNKKGEIRLQVFDILNQNVNTSRNTSQNYIQDISYKVLNQYWMLSFTYNIRRFAGKSVQGGAGPGKEDIKIIGN